MLRTAIVIILVAGLPALASAGDAKADYAAARTAYYALKADPAKKQFRHHWLPVIAGFDRIVKDHPKSPEAPKAAYTAAHLVHDLYEVSRSRGDSDDAIHRYAAVAKRFSTSSLADDALYERSSLLLRRGQKPEAAAALRVLLTSYPKGDMRSRAKKRLASLGAAANPENPVAMVAKVVLDPGHGGRDRGATGHKGLEEATVNLQIAKRVAKKLREKGIQVQLTRTEDKALTLTRRAKMAAGADLFVSIHANAARSSKAHGIETYYLDVTHNRYAKRLAHRENDGAEMDETEFILADLATKVSARESKALAHSVQKRLVRAARRVNSGARDLGVKAAMFHVLLGARCPSILVETAFVSNPREAAMLRRADYQGAIAEALADGVWAHLSDASAVASVR